jgi:hypothetical protein
LRAPFAPKYRAFHAMVVRDHVLPSLGCPFPVQALQKSYLTRP